MQEPERTHLTDEESEQPFDDIPGEEDAGVPPRGLLYALVAGVAAAVLSILLNIVITFLNAPLLQQAAKVGSAISYTLALTVVGVQCLNFFFSLLICFLAGYFVGKMAVRRRLGFYSGALAGAIIYLVSLFVRYIPNYPGNAAAATSPGAGGVVAGLVTVVAFLVVWSLVGGLISLWGAWVATRKHPFYSA